MATYQHALKIKPDYGKAVKLAKIDVEGFEVHVLEGMELETKDLPCYIWIEIVDTRNARQAGLGTEQRGKTGTVRDWLRVHGYEEDKNLQAGGAADYVFSRKSELCS